MRSSLLLLKIIMKYCLYFFYFQFYWKNKIYLLLFLANSSLFITKILNSKHPSSKTPETLVYRNNRDIGRLKRLKHWTTGRFGDPCWVCALIEYLLDSSETQLIYFKSAAVRIHNMLFVWFIVFLKLVYLQVCKHWQM